MIKSVIGGVAAAALLSGPVLAAPASKSNVRGSGFAWVISPTETGCRVDLELTARSGAIMPVSLTSDGQLISLRFAKPDLPARAFLPIRIDRRPFSSLMLRGADGAGELVLSEETLAAMRKGSTLGVAWLTDEPLQASLGGSEQGLSNLRICGAQTAQRHRDRTAAAETARDRAEAEARAKAVTDAQLTAIKAQTAAAEAQRRTVEEAAERQRRTDAEAAAERQRQAVLEAKATQDRAYAEAARQRAYADETAQRRAYDTRPPADEEDDEPRWQPPPPPRPYYPPRYPYRRD